MLSIFNSVLQYFNWLYLVFVLWHAYLNWEHNFTAIFRRLNWIRFVFTILFQYPASSKSITPSSRLLIFIIFSRVISIDCMGFIFFWLSTRGFNVRGLIRRTKNNRILDWDTVGFCAKRTFLKKLTLSLLTSNRSWNGRGRTDSASLPNPYFLSQRTEFEFKSSLLAISS